MVNFILVMIPKVIMAFMTIVALVVILIITVSSTIMIMIMIEREYDNDIINVTVLFCTVLYYDKHYEKNNSST